MSVASTSSKPEKRSPASRNWFITVNNHPGRDATVVELEKIFASFKTRWMGYGFEVASTGTPHVHVILAFESAKTRVTVFNRFKKGGLKADCRTMRGTHQQAWNYLANNPDKPDPDVGEMGEFPAPAHRESAVQEAKRKRKLDPEVENNMILHSDLCALVEDNTISAIKLKSYYEARMHYMRQQPPPVRENVNGVWLYGPTGTGKSHAARFSYVLKDERVYAKSGATKWFDGYDNQEIVVLEDFDPTCVGKSTLSDLKNWSDKWPVLVEYKGGSVYLRHRLLIVTSNHSIEECFPDASPEDIQALMRRFKKVHMNKPIGVDLVRKRQREMIVMSNQVEAEAERPESDDSQPSDAQSERPVEIEEEAPPPIRRYYGVQDPSYLPGCQTEASIQGSESEARKRVISFVELQMEKAKRQKN